MTEKDNSKCMLCDRVVRYSGGSTSGLHRHLETQHEKYPEKSPSKGSKYSRTLDGYYSRASKSLGEILVDSI